MAVVLAASVAAAALLAIAVRRRNLWCGAAALAVVATAGLISLRVPPGDDGNRGAGAKSEASPKGLAQLSEFIPAIEPADGYVSSQSCAECHRRQHDTWHASYHRTMTQQATPGAVLGNFDNQRVGLEGTIYDLYRRGDDYRVKITPPARGPKPPRVIDLPIVQTTGSHHMQVYWVPRGSGRTLADLPICYLLEDHRWISRDAAFLKPRAEDPNAPRIGRWNAECINCHATHGRSRQQPPPPEPAETYDSRVAEFGIACEACHGPAERHVQFHRGESADIANLVNPAELPHDRSAQVCGRCHGITIARTLSELSDRFEHGHRFRPGERLADSVHLVRVDQPTRDRFRATNPMMTDRTVERIFDMEFWSDGKVRIVGREFNGLAESACYRKGEMTCVSCHVLHQPEGDRRPIAEWANDQLKAQAMGDAACTQCHDGTTFGSSRHTHHRTDSSGSRCDNCHMPHTSYGLLKAVRSHTIDVPSVEASLRTGRPNACNLCHLDQTLEWTAQRLHEWYSTPQPEMKPDQARMSAAVHWALSGDAGQRALIAWHMGWEPALEVSGRDWQAPFLAALLDDPYLAVRYIAKRSLTRLPGFAAFDYDFLGSDADAGAAAERAAAIWGQGRASAGAAGKSTSQPSRSGILLSPDGQFDQATFDRLKANRDDRIVHLAE